MGSNGLILDYLYSVIGYAVFCGYSLLVLGIVLRVIMKRRPIGVSLAWLSLIFTIPVLGVSLYLLFGEIRLGRQRVERARALYAPFARWVSELVSSFTRQPARVSAAAEPISELVFARLGSPMLGGNAYELLDEPHAILFAIAQDIRAAKVSCYLEFYIWQQGGWADEVATALIDAAQRGVDCRVFLDSFGGAAYFDSDWPMRFAEAGIRLIEVLPVGAWRIPLQRQDLRMHRKLVVIDDLVAYTGSMNLVDPRYFKRDAGVGQWIDVMVRLQGPIVPLIWSLFVRDWELETGERLLETQQHSPEYLETPDAHLQLIPSGPFTGGDCIQQILLLAIYQARRSLVITTPYFVPDDSLVAALRSAAERGIRVQLILPSRNDSFMVRHASDAFLNELLISGVEIYRFQQGLLHTKSVVVDECMALFGTLNLDRRSLWLNFETTLLVDDPVFAQQLTRIQHGYMAQAQRLYYSDWRQRSWGKRLLENVLYLFSPLL